MSLLFTIVFSLLFIFFLISFSYEWIRDHFVFEFKQFNGIQNPKLLRIFTKQSGNDGYV